MQIHLMVLGCPLLCLFIEKKMLFLIDWYSLGWQIYPRKRHVLQFSIFIYNQTGAKFRTGAIRLNLGIIHINFERIEVNKSKNLFAVCFVVMAKWPLDEAFIETSFYSTPSSFFILCILSETTSALWSFFLSMIQK